MTLAGFFLMLYHIGKLEILRFRFPAWQFARLGIYTAFETAVQTAYLCVKTELKVNT